MVAFETYVMVNLQTTGLKNPRITELCLLAVKRNDVLATTQGTTPRVQDKLTLCFNPGSQISPEASKISGLTNELLANKSSFSMATFTMINTFLETLTKPICLIAHTGYSFHFPILKQYLLELGGNFDSNLRYADSLHGLFDIMEGHGVHNVTASMAHRYDVDRYYKPSNYVQSYELQQVYQRTFADGNELQPGASNKCFMLLKLFIFKAREMVEWFDKHNLLFAEVVPNINPIPEEQQ